MKFTNLLWLVLVTLSTNIVFAQERNYLKEADKAFSNGNYEIAVKLYRAEYVINGTNVDIKIKKCLDCIADTETAQQAISNGDIERAKEFYNYILERNPSDKAALNYIQSHLIPEWQKDCWIIHLDKDEFLAVQSKTGSNLSYYEASKKASSDNLGNFNDWRLPTCDEMKIIARDQNANIVGTFWCIDQGMHISSSSTYINGRESSIETIHHHQAYDSHSSENIYIEDRWSGTGDTKKPLFTHLFDYLTVRKYKDNDNKINKLNTTQNSQNTSRTKRTKKRSSASSLKVKRKVKKR